MAADTSYIQPGHHTLTQYLYGKIELLDFIREVFGAEITHPPRPEPNGNFHAEAKIGDSMILVGNGYYSNHTMTAATWIYVKDVDATYAHAIRAGATAIRPPADQTWGDRVGGVKDQAGNTWWIATHRRK